MLGNTLVMANEPPARLADFVDTVMMLATEIPSLQDLIRQAVADGSIKISFVEPRRAEFGASWDANDRTIRLANNLSPLKLIDALIFELCNANNPYINSLELLAPNRFANANDFAYAVEHCEYHYTTVPAQGIITEVLFNPNIMALLRMQGTAPEHVSRYLDSMYFDNFNEYLRAQAGSHTQAYKQDWVEMVGSHDSRRARNHATPNYNEFFQLTPHFPGANPRRDIHAHEIDLDALLGQPHLLYNFDPNIQQELIVDASRMFEQSAQRHAVEVFRPRC